MSAPSPDLPAAGSPSRTTDQLAADRTDLAAVRTHLANERTLLAYVRTSLMLAGTGGTLLKFFADDRGLVMTGYACMVAGVALLIGGGIRFVAIRRRVIHA